MAHRKRKNILTPMQKCLIKILVDNHKLHVAQRVSRADCYVRAGYSDTSPAQGVASAIQKEHIKNAIIRLAPDFYGVKKPSDAPTTDAEEAMANLAKFSKVSAQGAYNYTEALRKQAAEGGGVDIVPVLLSAFLTESELDQYRDKPQDVVVATDNKPPEPKASADDNAESPVNVDDTARCEVADE